MKKITIKKFQRLSLLLLISLSYLGSYGQTEYPVNDETELDAALTAAVNNDVIVFQNNIVITSQKTISSKTITINGQGYELSVPVPGLDDMGRFNTSPSSFRVLTLSSSANVTINNLTMKGGETNANGGAISVNSGTTLNLNNSVVSNTNAGANNGGGGIYIQGTMFMKNSFVRRNAARYGGGIVVTGTGRAYVEESTLVENRSTATNGGGGAAECQSGSVLYFNNSTLSNNQSTEIGGAINNYRGTVYFINSSATGNVAFGGNIATGGAIGNNGGNVYILNSLFAHNYRRTSGTVSNPTGFVLDDFEPYSSPGNVRVYHSIHHAALPTGIGVNTGNVQYTGAANGSNNTIFSGGLLSKITDNDGNEIGDQVFRPFLYNNQGSVAPTLKLGSFVSQTANLGVPTRFSNNNNSNPTIAYFSGGSWTDVSGTSASGQEVTEDQVGNTRNSTTPTRGAMEDELNETLYIIKVNGASGGTVNGGTIYGDVYPDGTEVTLTAIANSGQQFSQWDYVDGGSGTASNDNPYTFTVNQDVTLVPVFSNLSTSSYTITYIGNGNTGGNVPSGGTFSAATTIAGANTLVREGFEFSGWNTNSNGSGDAYADGDNYSAGDNLTLYAQWTEIMPFEWNGSEDNSWTDGGNWSEANPPTSSDDVLILGTATNMPIVSTDVEVNNLEIESNADLTINPEIILKVNGNITNNGQITFKSDATGDSYFDEFSGSISGTGDVVVEKYYPAQRAFRMVTSPVNSTTSIYDNWQNGGNNVTGIGTHITGSATGDDGFDQTETGNPSMFEFITGTGWQAIPNTNATNLEAGKPYRLMIRGDLGIDLTDGEDENATTLIATGDLQVGTVTEEFPSAASSGTTFAFLANPYQSRIDVSEVLTANSSKADATKLWVWDPMINTRGAFVTISDITSGNGTATPLVDGLTSQATKFIEPGQAFFIELSGTNSNISFTESVKDVTTPIPAPQSLSNNQMSMLLSLQNEESQIIDGIRLRFAADGISKVDAADIAKMSNIDENLASVNQNSLFSIQRRNFPENEEEIPLFTNNWRKENYSFVANLSNLDELNIYLVDAYLGTETLLNDGEAYSFSVDASVAASVDTQRFSLKFGNETMSVEDLENNLMNLYPNPAQDVVNIQTNLALGTQVEIEIYNLLGQQVYAKQQELKSATLQVNVNRFNSGIYMVKLTDEAGHQHTHKLIKK